MSGKPTQRSAVEGRGGSSGRLTVRVPERCGGMRLDQALAELFPEYSRSRLQQWIKAGQVTVDERPMRPRDKVSGGERVEVCAELEPRVECEPQAIPLHIIYEDAALLVIDKPAGLVVHPAAGNWAGTLQNALLHYAPELVAIPRAGLVHRLDKDTSGLLVVARTLSAHKHLVEQLQARSVTREYDAVVAGVLTGGGTVERPIGRHPVDRKRMAVHERGRPAITHYRLEERYRAHTRIRVRLETGRTHQIRVHMASLGHPLLGDPVYGGRLRLPAGAGDSLSQALRGFRRQALHAARLALEHPESGAPMEWLSPLPTDMVELIGALRADAREAQPSGAQR
jgi:23S rRNA pseudouridine1911/1915/1917 synthase